LDRNRFKGSGGNSQCHVTTLSTGGIHLRTQHVLPVLLAARGWASASSLCQRQWERSDATASFGAPTTPPHSPSCIIRCGCNVKRPSPDFPVGKRGGMAAYRRRPGEQNGSVHYMIVFVDESSENEDVNECIYRNVLSFVGFKGLSLKEEIASIDILSNYRTLMKLDLQYGSSASDYYKRNIK